MTNRIVEDHDKFRSIVEGRTRKKLKHLITGGSIVKQRPKGGKLVIPIKSIESPRYVYGNSGEGVGRGPGKPGDVIGQDPQPGEGQGEGGGSEEGQGEGTSVQVDMDYVLKFMKEELELPEMKPKPTATYDEIKIKYNDISKNGPESLRHTRKTLRETMRRMAMTGDLDKEQITPGSTVPLKVITPINSDKRYRQYNEVKIPSSNAVIFFLRDFSGSMDDKKCDIINDMAWWMETWISQYYKKIERCYCLHDTVAKEVDQNTFYSLRNGGGTKVSTAFDFVNSQLENRFPPHAYNVYVFYFGDGDNWHGNNDELIESVKKIAQIDIANLVGFTQVMPWSGNGTVNSIINDAISDGNLNEDLIRTFNIDNDIDRDQQIMNGIKYILGKQEV